MFEFVIRLLPYVILALAGVTWFTARELGDVFDERARHRVVRVTDDVWWSFYPPRKARKADNETQARGWCC